MKKLILLMTATALLIPALASASLATDLHGEILLQVEEHGEAWYVYPTNSMRYYLKDGAAAYTIMRFLSLGITDADLALVPSVKDTTEMNSSTSACATNALANRLKGKILLQVEQHGEAWYVDVEKCRRIYLRDGQAAFDVMRFLGLGITNNDLVQIPVANDSALPEGYKAPSPYVSVETRTFEIINAHRVSIGVAPLVWNQDMSDIARGHSKDMATGVEPKSHNNFDLRVIAMKELVPNYNGGAENLAWNFSNDPGLAGFNWWLTSEGHRASIENGFYDVSGIGVWKSSSGEYFLTQMFANTD